MADKSVTIGFQTREEQYQSLYPDDSLAGFNERGEPLRARLEIDTDETVGSEPYKLVYNIALDRWVGQDVFLKYASNSSDPLTVRTTNGTAELVSQGLVSEEKTESIVFTNETDRKLSGIPSGGTVSTEWIGNVLTSGPSEGEGAALCNGMKTPGPNVTFDGERVRIPESATGVLKVTYTETFARIKSNAAEAGTVVVAVCQGKLAEAEQYEVEYTETSWRGNPDSQCCQEGPTKDIAISEPFSIDPGTDGAVYVVGGCPPFTWTVSGTGLTMKAETTEKARFNTVQASSDACGDGILRVTDDCGDYVEAVIETDVGCCADQGGEAFAWADGNPEVLCLSPAVGDPIGVEGGVAPYNWLVTVGGAVAWWGNAETTDPVNNLYNTATEYTKQIRVRVSDSCGEILYRDFEIGMEWADDNPETIAQGDPGDPAEVAVAVDGGVGPYTWTVSGTGFSFAVSETQDRVNLLCADAAACGFAEITVMDSCGDTASGEMRCTGGSRWELITSGALEEACPWEGVVNAYEVTYEAGRYSVWAMHGGYKVMHRIDYLNGAGSCSAAASGYCVIPGWSSRKCADPDIYPCISTGGLKDWEVCECYFNGEDWDCARVDEVDNYRWECS